MKQTVVVYGPQGSGKTRNAKAIMEHYGLTKLVDGWTPRDPMPKTDTLVLTQYVPFDLPNATPAQLEARRRFITVDIEVVKKNLGLK